MFSNVRQGLRTWRWYLLGPLLLLVVACSSTTFVYNRLDFLLSWYLERYVDLDRAQSKAFDAQLEVLLDWHRREELPRYLDFLNDVEADLASDLSVVQLQGYADRAEDAWLRVREPALEQLLLLAEDLSDEQLRDFMAVMDKKQRKYERKYLDRDDEEMRDDAADSLEDTLKDYLGRLNGEQLDRVRAAANELRRSDAVWLRERSVWTAELAQILEREPGWQQRTRSLVEEWENNLDPEVQALYDHNQRTVQAAIVDVVNDRTEKQDVRLRKKLAALREDLELLISESEPLINSPLAAAR
ncbi:DUF6279 family lipoprotein [Congregibacter sp.]|uniref:DUF6279 family lipoprotein n=1 Tax=Congregibacter sp. TaxID=2744308 RepID=UPI003F6C8450